MIDHLKLWRYTYAFTGATLLIGAVWQVLTYA